LQENLATALALQSLGVKSGYLNAVTENCVTVAVDDDHGYSEDAQEKLLQEPAQLQNEAYSVPRYLILLYKHRMTVLMPAFLANLVSVIVGLALGDIIWIMALVVCLPAIIALLAHWKCLTSEGAAYPVKCLIVFAVYFVSVFSISLCNMLFSPARWRTHLRKWVYSVQAVPLILTGAAGFLMSSRQLIWHCANRINKKDRNNRNFVVALFTALFLLIFYLVLDATGTFDGTSDFLVIFL
jgi:hypothetical protein